MDDQSDIAKEIRKIRLLVLSQLLHLINNKTSLPISQNLYLKTICQDEVELFFVSCIFYYNVTEIILQMILSNLFQKECNSRGNVRHVLNEYFAAVMFHIYWIWKTERKTIKDSGFLIKDAEAHCKRNVKSVLQKLQVHLRKYPRNEADITDVQ
ncbi:unnamed protein product, partial [Meganyctiphanes norvegica]